MKIRQAMKTLGFSKTCTGLKNAEEYVLYADAARRLTGAQLMRYHGYSEDDDVRCYADFLCRLYKVPRKAETCLRRWARLHRVTCLKMYFNLKRINRIIKDDENSRA